MPLKMTTTPVLTPSRLRALAPLRTTVALGFVLAALAGCGGGSDDTVQPPAPTLAAPTNFTFELIFRWTATPGATHYELHVDPDGPGPLPEAKAADANNADAWIGFKYRSTDSQAFTGNFADPSNAALDLAASINATYRLRACDATGCGSFTAPIVQEYSYEFPSGRVPIFHSLSKDGLTLAMRQFGPDEIPAVSVFTRSSSAHPWQRQAFLRSGTTRFGYPLALSDDGNTLAVDEWAPPEGDLSPSSTRTYIYQRSGSTWSQQATLTPSNIPSACEKPCSMSGSTLALSADGSLLAESMYFSSQTTRKYMAAVVIHARNGSTWSQQALLETGDSSAEIMALARDGKTLAVNEGAQFNVSDSTPAPSFALVFTQQSNGTWSQQARLPVGIMSRVNGFSVLLSTMQLSDDGNTLAVLAENGVDERAVHAADLSCGPLSEGYDKAFMALFTRNGTAWQRQAAISRGYQGPSRWALARDGNALLYGDELFTRSNGAWVCP